MKLRIFCNWMTPASNIVIQSQFGRLATADVLGLKPIISLSLDWLCGITAGFPQHSRWWRLKGISSRSLILLHPCPNSPLFCHWRGKSPFSCMMLTLHSKTRAEVQGPRSPAFLALQKFAGVNLQAKNQLLAHLRWQEELTAHQISPDGWQSWGELHIRRIMKPLGPSGRVIVYFRFWVQLPALMATGTDSKQALFKTHNWRVWDNAKAKQIIFIKEENKTVITPVPCLPDVINYVEVIPGHTILRRNNLDFFFFFFANAVGGSYPDIGH